MKALTLLKLLRQRSRGEPLERLLAGYRLAEVAANYLSPRSIATEAGKIWLQDDEFFDFLRRFDGDNIRFADRRYFLRELLRLATALPGDTAECGVFRGACSWLIARHFEGRGKIHHGFDSFAGLSTPDPRDGNYWTPGDLRCGEEAVRRALDGLPVRLYPGWIPQRFPEIAARTFCFVHIDVDLYQPTLDSLAFFYPRTVPGGVIVCDDYGFSTCPGARQACDEFMATRPEPILRAPTGQGIVIKRP